jgi:hypothetical protein
MYSGKDLIRFQKIHDKKKEGMSNQKYLARKMFHKNVSSGSVSG